VDRVARTRNLARIPELADEPELLEWLVETGLTLDEAAWIQPAYNGWPGGPGPAREEGIPSRYLMTSAVAGTVGGLSVGWNWIGLRSGAPPSLGVTLGVAAGASSVALGASRLDDDLREVRRLAVGNLAAGILTMATAIHAGRRIPVEVRPWFPPDDASIEEGRDGPSRAVGIQATIRR
jgi:hypothetical protein